MTAPSFKDYLGDSVYADFDGYAVVLTTWNGHADDPRNVIVLEPEVLKAFDNYRARLSEALKATQSTK